MPNFRIWNRKLHRWGAIAVAAPFLVVIGSGVLLQLKKQLDFVQPPEQRGTVGAPQVDMPTILVSARSVPEAGIESWDDIDRLDVRPGKGLIKVVSVNNWELQLDGASGEVLQSAYRRSDFFESLHDGSWFHPQAKLWIFLPSGVLVFGLWLTGIYLYLLPIRTRRAKARKATPGAGDAPRSTAAR